MVTQSIIPRLLWNPKVSYRIHKNPPLVPIMSQTHPVHIFPSYFPKIDSNIILPFMPTSSDWSLPFSFSDHNFVYISRPSPTCYTPHPFHPPWLDKPNNILWSVHFINAYKLNVKNYFLNFHFECRSKLLLMQFTTCLNQKPFFVGRCLRSIVSRVKTEVNYIR